MKRYPSKLLLFGEHVLLLGATALAVPLHLFGGQWQQEPRQRPGYRQRLLDFADSPALRALPGLDLRRFRAHVEAGWIFQSNIPSGYGLGSSGALCAAVYDRYATEKTSDLAELKRIFAGMESFFHGASSGIDPLTSYLGMPLRIHDKTQVATVQPAQWAADAPLVFLVDTQQPRRTGPLVQWFLERSGTADFGGALEQTYLPAHEQLVEGWLRADPLLFWPNLERASQFQFEHFEPMIPAGIRPLWQRSLERPGVSLKICGAGGGGFLLGFARSKAEAEALCQGWETIFLPPNP